MLNWLNWLNWLNLLNWLNWLDWLTSECKLSIFNLLSQKTKSKYPLIATIVFIIIVAIMLINAIIYDFEQAEFYFRLLGVFAILDVLGTITTTLSSRRSEATERPPRLQ